MLTNGYLFAIMITVKERNEVHKMKTQITVKELMEQLQTLCELGRADDLVWFRDYNDIDHEIEKGVHDTYKKNVVLG